MSYIFKTMKSPVALLKLVGSEAGLAAVLWEDDDPKRVKLEATTEAPDHPVLLEAERQLGEYFAGKRKAFTVKLDYRGTPFQKKVWDALLEIPFGETRTYGDLAKQIGSPAAARAVGAVNGKNPFSIIGPCHRVIGSTGRLTGFAGGLEAKAILLRLEGGEVGEVPVREPDSRKAAISGSPRAGEPAGRPMDGEASAIRLALGKPASSDPFDELFNGAN
jgi:methylated-DNA-[protein]-cysteine S-methyltransferase